MYCIVICWMIKWNLLLLLIDLFFQNSNERERAVSFVVVHTISNNLITPVRRDKLMRTNYVPICLGCRNQRI